MKVIEFFGMPRAGKTTAVELAESYLKKQGARVRLVYEGARISPLDKSDRFNYNAWSFHNTMNRVLEARLDHYDFILVDRGVLDHLAFSESIKQFCGEKDIMMAQNYYKQFLDMQDIEIYFTVNPDEAVNREYKHKPYVGRVFQEQFLSELLQSYEQTLDYAREQGRDVMEINGNLKLDTNLEAILEFSKRLINQKTQTTVITS